MIHSGTDIYLGVLQHNLLSSVAAVSRMVQLRHLDVSHNMLTCLRPLAPLEGLEQLCVDSNNIGDLAPLSDLSALMELYAAHNTLTSMHVFAAIAELPKLFVADFRGNAIAKIEDYYQYAVFRLRRLCVLDGDTVSAAQQAAARNKFVGRLTMEFLEERAPGTKWNLVLDLDISDLRIRDIGSALTLGNFPSLTDLRISQNLLTSINGLVGLPRLTALNADGNRLGSGQPPILGPKSDVLYSSSAFFEGDVCMDSLGNDSIADARVSMDAVDNGSPVRAAEPTSSGDLGDDVVLPALQVLQLGDNRLFSIDMLGLSRLTGLRSLFLQNNQIAKVGGLAALSSLEELVLDRNRIKSLDIDSFKGLTALRELRMEDNGIRRLSHLSSLPALRCLQLGGNRVLDITEVMKLAEATSIVELSLAGCPISRKPGYRTAVLMRLEHVQVLDGREVTAEDRAAAFMAQVQGEAVADGLQPQAVVYPLRVASLQFQEQAVRSVSLARFGATQAGHIQQSAATGTSRDDVAKRLGLLGLGHNDRFARAKRR
eukprot:jgi/Ulvmu1/9227/UM005_0327.1